MIQSLKLYDPIQGKVRLGNKADGGYALPVQSIGRSRALFSYGVGSDISFERDYVDITNNRAYCFDHTIESIDIPQEYQNNISWTKEGLSGVAGTDMGNILDHYKRLNIEGRILAQVDIEGAEFEFILNTDISAMAKITTGIIIEFHFIEDPTKQQQFFECLNLLNEHYYLCHAHGNNYAKPFVYKELHGDYYALYSLPEVIELTFINKDLVKYEKRDIRTYPCSYLDNKNDLNKEEIDLSFLNLI